MNLLHTKIRLSSCFILDPWLWNTLWSINRVLMPKLNLHTRPWLYFLLLLILIFQIFFSKDQYLLFSIVFHINVSDLRVTISSVKVGSNRVQKSLTRRLWRYRLASSCYHLDNLVIVRVEYLLQHNYQVFLFFTEVCRVKCAGKNLTWLDLKLSTMILYELFLKFLEKLGIVHISL